MAYLSNCAVHDLMDTMNFGFMPYDEKEHFKQLVNKNIENATAFYNIDTRNKTAVRINVSFEQLSVEIYCWSRGTKKDPIRLLVSKDQDAIEWLITGVLQQNPPKGVQITQNSKYDTEELTLMESGVCILTADGLNNLRTILRCAKKDTYFLTPYIYIFGLRYAMVDDHISVLDIQLLKHLITVMYNIVLQNKIAEKCSLCKKIQLCFNITEDHCNICNNSCYEVYDNVENCHDTTCIKNNQSECLSVLENCSFKYIDAILCKLLVLNHVYCSQMELMHDKKLLVKCDGVTYESVMNQYKDKIFKSILENECFYVLSENMWKNRLLSQDSHKIFCKNCNNRPVYTDTIRL